MAQVTRRQMISMSCKSFLTTASILPFLNSCSSNPAISTELAWQDFISQIHDLAGEYDNEGFNEELYLKKVLALAKRLNLDDKNINAFYKNYSNSNKRFPEFTKMHKEKSFQVTLLEFEPGEKIPLHDHPDMSGVILCTEGEIDIENFDLLKKKSTNDKLLIKRTSSVKMEKNSLGSLSSTRGNIHSLEAKKFTRLIDVFTPPYDKRRIKESHYFVKSSTTYNKVNGLYEARYR